MRGNERSVVWHGAFVLAFALAFSLAGGAAVAAPKKPAPAPGALAAGSAPARFFTLNELLARGDRPGAGGLASIEKTNTATDADANSSVAGPEPFGLYAFRAPEGALWVKWRALEADIKTEAAAFAQCAADAKSCTPEAARFAAIVEETKARDGRARLETANRLVNGALRYVNDYEQHGVADRWTAPLGALAAGQGDCEEYAVTKFAVLRAAGVAESEMRLVLVRDMQIRVDHAVLAVRAGAGWLVLDNRRGTVVETADVRHYQPLYAVGAGGVKLFAAPYANWGEGEVGEFAAWTLRGSDGEPFAAGWTLRGIDGGTLDIEPAAASF
ncbi:MAG: transglutaminase-like cysteine peptidase [Bradyrhizobiaceae bacterium]|nr:transglutaminase-like cysteine peptidase [Bradyrhizobiaceae bacterium]